MSSKKKNSLAKVNDEVITEQLFNVTSTDLNNGKTYFFEYFC